MLKEITLPYLYEPREYQIPVLKALDSGAKRAVLVWNRRSGKDTTAWNYMIRRAWEEKGSYYYVLPTYRHAKKVIWDAINKDGMPLLDHIPKEIRRKKPNETEMQIELKNGSIIQLIGAKENADSLVGTNPRGIVFSEYSLIDPEVWGYLRPILVENGGWAIFVFTPRGLNHAYKILQEAKSNPSWFSQVLTVNDTHSISPEEVEEERRSNVQALFNQEYMCEFLNDAGAVFRRIDENLWDGDMPTEYGHSYQLGADLGKHMDWTVLTPFDLNTFKVGKQERFQQIDWNLQKSRIEATSLRYNQAHIVLDATGIGDPILDDLTFRGLNVEGFKFTTQSKENLLKNLAILLEQDKIKIPNDPILLEELRGMQFQKVDPTDSSSKTEIVSMTEHDDCVMSLALAVWKASEPFGRARKEQEYGIYSHQTYG